MTTADVIDAALELTIVPSFTRAGPAARRHLDGWKPLSDYDLSDRHVVITGATSGLGLAAAKQMARLGATLTIIGREESRLGVARDEIIASAHRADVTPIVCDVGELAQVEAAAAQILDVGDRLDVLVHNAGALVDHRVDNTAGVEMTVAAQVVGPFALTSRLLPALASGDGPGRVITMSSGGMYAAPLRVERMQMTADRFRGSEQYARAKRAQVTLNELWAERFPADDVVFHAMHPGWADTPGVTASLPTFARIVGPLLRTADEGADTLVWLAADELPGRRSGDFWLDRRRRTLHRLGRTRASDTPERRRALWDWCVEQAAADPLSR